MIKNRKLFLVISSMLVICGIIVIFLFFQNQNKEFDQTLAFQNIETQMAFGPRVPGSEAHQAFIDWAGAELTRNDWQVELQTGEISGHALTNIIGKKGVRIMILASLRIRIQSFQLSASQFLERTMVHPVWLFCWS
jgi:hypothetical protein